MNLGGTVRMNNRAIAVVLLGLTALYITYSWIRTPRDKILSGEAESGKQVNVGDLLCAAIAAAEAGGLQVKAVRESNLLNEKGKGKTREGVKDVATDGDMKSHRVMTSTLTSAFPHVKVISEEHDELSTTAEPVQVDRDCPALQKTTKIDWTSSDSITVWIDPLDATKEYTENLLQYVTTMVCVAVKGKPIIGVIHQPFERKTHWGWVGHAVSAELVEFNKSNDADHKSFIISRSHTGNEVEKLISSNYVDAKILQAGGAGYKSLEVASRRQGAYVHKTHIKKWDVCAGHAILSSLGGSVVTLKNEEITYGPNDNHLIQDGLLGTLDTTNFYAKLLNH